MCEGLDCGEDVSKWLSNILDYKEGSVRLFMFAHQLGNSRTFVKNGVYSPKMIADIVTLNNKVLLNYYWIQQIYFG